MPETPKENVKAKRWQTYAQTLAIVATAFIAISSHYSERADQKAREENKTARAGYQLHEKDIESLSKNMRLNRELILTLLKRERKTTTQPRRRIIILRPGAVTRSGGSRSSRPRPTPPRIGVVPRRTPTPPRTRRREERRVAPRRNPLLDKLKLPPMRKQRQWRNLKLKQSAIKR